MYVPRPCMHHRARMRSPRRTVSRCSSGQDSGPRFGVARRLVDGFRANSFTAPRSAAAHRSAALARECEQIKLEIRPLIALRTNAGCYRPFPHGSAQGCGGL